MPDPSQKPSERIRVRRFHERGRYDTETIHSILDAGIFCHVAFQHEDGPVVIPTFYWRDNDRLYFHGSAASRMMKVAEGRRICVAVTLLDGLVLARSAFHHSANYRSVVIHGVTRAIESPEAKERQLEHMMERLFPGRWSELRPVRQQELKATRILYVTLTEASAKVRAGPLEEDKTDLNWPVWAGVLPIELSTSPGVPDAHCAKGEAAPLLALLNRKHAL